MAERRREQGDSVTLPKERVDKPKMYKCIFHNDDYTSMEFVVFLLTEIFKHTPASATRLMLTIHKAGAGVAGVYTYEVAETKLTKAMDLAREYGHPLQITMEPE
jgi:ATP-dependent Clp protease adaptor protein ClpS